MFEFDADTRVEVAREGVFRGAVTDRWNIGDYPNGGYVMSIGLRALQIASGRPDPLSATAHFVRPALPNTEILVHTELVKQGKRHTTLSARLLQQEREIARMLAVFGDLPNSDGPRHISAKAPQLPERAACRGAGEFPHRPRFSDRVEQLFDPPTIPFVDGREGPTEFRAWTRFSDGRPADILSLALFADGLPPPILNVAQWAWVPTVELTVHFRARPAAGWLRSNFRTQFMFGGYLEEDGEIWDDDGNLVALSRQLASAPRPATPSNAKPSK